jgi:hypothetical protein
MGEEEATLETVEARDETLVAQQELKERAVRMRVVIFDKLIEADRLKVNMKYTGGR